MRNNELNLTWKEVFNTDNMDLSYLNMSGLALFVRKSGYTYYSYGDTVYKLMADEDNSYNKTNLATKDVK